MDWMRRDGRDFRWEGDWVDVNRGLWIGIASFMGYLVVFFVLEVVPRLGCTSVPRGAYIGTERRLIRTNGKFFFQILDRELSATESLR